MSRIFKTWSKQLLAFFNTFTTEITDKDQVRSLLTKLYPVRSSHELIRLGPKGDGGYLVPDDLENIKACFSPGVSDISGFERECAELGMRVFLADKSVDKPATEHDFFTFTKKFIGSVSSEEFMTLDGWITDSLQDDSSDLLLQMDIEGYEYETILSATEKVMRRFRIIVVEFHLLDKLWSEPFFTLASRAFEKTLLTHTCVHIHPNNCKNSVNINGVQIPKVMEFTFLRNDRLENLGYQQQFPHPLDCDNTTDKTIILPTSWYKN